MKKSRKKAPQKNIAMIFDFDDTLTDDTITGLLSEYDIDVVQFWKEVDNLVRREGWDPPLAYMKRMIDLAENGGPLSSLTINELHRFGKKLEFYPGIPKMFNELRDWTKSKYGDVGIKIQYYIVSASLREVIEGSKIKHYLRDFWGCSFFTDSKGIIRFPKCSMTFTEKTRCLFQINKGCVGPRYRGKPGEVNKSIPKRERPIPFQNMIYVGDGLTDIACMSILDNLGGTTFGVFDVEKLERGEYKARSWLLLRRGVPVLPAKYRQGEGLRMALEGALIDKCRRIRRRYLK